MNTSSAAVTFRTARNDTELPAILTQARSVEGLKTLFRFLLCFEISIKRYLSSIGRLAFLGVLSLTTPSPTRGDGLPQNEIFDHFAEAAMSPHGTISPDGFSLFEWHKKEVRVAFRVEGAEKGSVLRRMSSAFDGDKRFLEEHSDVYICLGLWGDDDVVPSIYVIVGSQVDLARKSSELQSLFGLKQLSQEIRKSQGGVCFSKISVGSGGKIVRSVVFVDRHNSPNFCLRKELISSFGLFGELPEGAPSILARDLGYEFYQEMDGTMLSILYGSENSAKTARDAVSQHYEDQVTRGPSLEGLKSWVEYI